MKQATAGTLSGCVIWILSIGIIATCVIPIFVAIGGISSSSQFVIRTMGNIICPAGTTAERYEYATTMTDEFGNSHPATGYELHCVDESGDVVQVDPVGYAFLWVGIVTLIGLILSGFLAFLLAAPLGVLIGRLFKRTQKPNMAANIEPQ